MERTAPEVDARKLKAIEEIILPSGRLKYETMESIAKQLPKPLFEQLVRRYVILGSILTEYSIATAESGTKIVGNDETIADLTVALLPAITNAQDEADNDLIYPIMRTKPSTLGAKPGVFYLGREADNDIVIQDMSVSRHHLKLTFRRGRYVIQDLESSNGLLINGKDYGTEEIDLHEGDDFQVGRYKFTLLSPRSLHATLLDMEGICLTKPGPRSSSPTESADATATDAAAASQEMVIPELNLTRDQLIANAKKYKKVLDGLRLFDTFSDSERFRIAAYFTNIKRFKIGEYIVRQGRPGKSFYVILEGSTVVTLDGKSTPIAHMRADDFFGEISYLQGEPRTSNIICEEPCTVLELGEHALSRLGVIIREKFKDMIIERVIERIEIQNKVIAEYREKDQGRFLDSSANVAAVTFKRLKNSDRNRKLIRMALDRTPFFDNFSEYEKTRLSSVFSHIRKVPPNTAIIRQDTMGNVFYALLAGEVSVVKEKEDGRKVLLATLPESSVFGEVSFLTKRQRTTHVISSKESLVLMVNSNLMTFMGTETREKYKDAIITILLERIDGQGKVIQKYKSSLYFNE
ncbi:MAG: cyclic nucleotide-binding domain-containing protein [Magnetococcales bacterium]|nr:cyclic nucleotide-binding domain-containing protein [Magnetococcales bacterium]